MVPYLIAAFEPLLQVVVGVIVNARGEVLLAWRPRHVHQGGRWEFPGGKVEPGEDALFALARELREELGITLEQARPLIRIRHVYPEHAVLLDVWRIQHYSGEPHGHEGQALEWVDPEHLPTRHLPEANLPIVTAVRLPSIYAITPEPQNQGAFLMRLDELLAAGIRLVQLRAKTLDVDAYRRLALQVQARCAAYGVRMLLNAPPDMAQELGVGVHLTSMQLMALKRRPYGMRREQLISASCHSLAEVVHACRIGVDFAVVGPVLPTASHLGSPVLGWNGLRALTEAATIPVYALGGMHLGHLVESHVRGAQGIASISALWDAPDLSGVALAISG